MAQATRTFRIFVSSTFPPSLELRRTGRDLKEGRHAPQRYVFPRPFDRAQGRSARAVRGMAVLWTIGFTGSQAIQCDPGEKESACRPQKRMKSERS